MILVILPPTHLLFALQVQKVKFNLHFFTRSLSLYQKVSTYILQISLMSDLIQKTAGFSSILLHCVCCDNDILVKVHEENVASQIYAAGKGILKDSSNNYEHSSLILVPRLWYEIWNQINKLFLLLHMKIQICLSQFEWIIYLRMILFHHALVIKKILVHQVMQIS